MTAQTLHAAIKFRQQNTHI